jgi:hypothetical protein
MLIEIPHEVSKAYRNNLQIINRLSAKGMSSKKKNEGEIMPGQVTEKRKSPQLPRSDNWGL